MDVVFYKNKSAPNVINKSLSEKHETSATFTRDDRFDVLNPTIVLKMGNTISSFIKYNYVYIADAKRYYFIDDMTTQGGLVVVKCRVDVLMSFKTDILNSKQYIMRQQSKNNSPYLADTMLPITSKHNYVSKEFGNPVILKNCNRVILATTGLGGTVVT